MIPSARIHRGLHRVGLVLAVPVLLAAAAMGVHETAYPSGGLAPGPNGTSYYPADYLVPVLVAVLALVLYAAARAVGWVFAGFIGSDGAPSP